MLGIVLCDYHLTVTWLSASKCSSKVLFQSSNLTGSVRFRVNFDGCLVQWHICVHQCILGICMRIMCLTQSTWKVWNGDGWSTVKTMPCCTSVDLVHGSASKVNCSGADAQVVFWQMLGIVLCDYHLTVIWLSASKCSSKVLFQSSNLTGSVRFRVNFDGCLVQWHICVHQCILGICMRISCASRRAHGKFEMVMVETWSRRCHAAPLLISSMGQLAK